MVSKFQLLFSMSNTLSMIHTGRRANLLRTAFIVKCRSTHHRYPVACYCCIQFSSLCSCLQYATPPRTGYTLMLLSCFTPIYPMALFVLFHLLECTLESPLMNKLCKYTVVLTGFVKLLSQHTVSKPLSVTDYIKMLRITPMPSFSEAFML